MRTATARPSVDTTNYEITDGSFETAGSPRRQGGERPDAWAGLGFEWFATQSGSGTLYGDAGDSGAVVPAPTGDKYLKIWPDNNQNPYGDEAPVLQEFSAVSPADRTFFLAANAMVHNSSPLKGDTEAVVWIKCFDDGYALQGDAQSVPLTKDSTLDTWGIQWITVTCGPNATKVQAVLSSTPRTKTWTATAPLMAPRPPETSTTTT